MPESYDLTQLDPNAFEHLVNLLALRVLGLGHTGFSPGSDGGRDGYFEGDAPYPSETDRWSGCWYIQSKFHKPNLSKDPQKWLIDRIKEELKEFQKPDSKRKWPDNWIIATNIDPSGTPETGAFDQARALVSKANPALRTRFHIWGGCKILDLLALYPKISEYYRHFITPGNILTEIYDHIKDAQAEVKTILRFLILSQFEEQQYTKLKQAGYADDASPGIHDLFIDLPFRCNEYNLQGLATEFLVRTTARCHRCDEEQPDTKEWRIWSRYPSRSRVWFIKGGPGQGKSTIGQYFCQIQRAALIIQKDGLRVSVKHKDLAAKIRKVAEKAGFWPLVPRVPIYIELKEFAQWFGQRAKKDPRGILTYLAECIATGVEQKVTTATLKRMLESRSWLIVFDGLDEVPHDVKDAVALEVCRFVDNAAFEINADLLTLCTSRPQGYSGQFSELDSSTIELISLSSEQALECARPILELGRTQSEAKKSFQILKSAMESRSVLELMTTPLQSHIMAVVVRDGERPPERRWRLYTNFYQVIKKREANRELPDKRLAKLLREDEQLLKTVHNRLGFVLHARAESSKGAQTRLNRAEFQTFVRDAVSQMTEIEVDETVNVLMKATTDRLVLVSTPDDGNHVRFDIRPLQEFFAAEFLYESVSVEELRQRMELIAGDAHWREVMHFLMSALIENGRQTELTVAVEVLENLNEGDEDFLRLLRRRLGRGAILAARLLQEGVLEQDKRMRQKFRECLEPLAASTEMELLQLLIQVSQPNSKSWLYNFLICCLREKNPTESIGAAIVLAHILPNEDERVEEVSNFFRSSPPEYFSCILTSRAPRPRSRVWSRARPIKNWFLKVTLQILLGQQWSFLTSEGFNTILDILRSKEEEIHEVAMKLGLIAPEIEIIKCLIQDKRYSISHEEDYGGIKIIYRQSGRIKSIFESKFIENFSNSKSEFLQLIHKIICFSVTKNRLHFIEILNLLSDKGIDLFNSICFYLETSIPVDKNTSVLNQIKHIESISDSEFEIWIKKQNFTSSSRRIRSVSPSPIDNFSSLEQWKNFVKAHPDIAIYIWEREEISISNPEKKLNNEELLIALINEILLVPNLLHRYPYIWGKLLKNAPSYEQDLRDAFLTASKESVTEDFPQFKFYSFQLNLPLEAPLLPHLVNSLLMRISLFYRDNVFHEDNKSDRELEFVSKSVHEMVGDVSLLTQISNDSALSINIRAAAALMLLLHSSENKDLKSQQKLLVELYSPEISYWYTRAVITCLSLVTTEESPAARWIIGSLLDVTRGNYEGRQYLEQLLALWRESSYAPIQKACVQEKWLSGTEYF